VLVSIFVLKSFIQISTFTPFSVFSYKIRSETVCAYMGWIVIFMLNVMEKMCWK
jgi:hypothetical protein